MRAWDSDTTAAVALSNFLQVVGTPPFMSPELVVGACVDERAADVWAFGCTLVHLASGRTPWASTGIRTPPALMIHIARAQCGPSVPAGLSLGLLDVLGLCFQVDPCDRPGAQELLEHPWMAST